MKIGSNEWIGMVVDGAAQLDLAVNQEQAAQLARHGQWLMAWNRKINLIAITDPKQVAIKHFIDAIAPLAHIPENGRLLDIGTGGGFPGISLKIMRPDQPMTLIDSVRKKVNFVKYVIRELRLGQVTALHMRAEALSDNISDDNRFAVVVCRALADTQAAVRLAGPLLMPKGRIVLYQGPLVNSDTAADNNTPLGYGGTAFRQKSLSYRLPYANIERRILILDLQT